VIDDIFQWAKLGRTLAQLDTRARWLALGRDAPQCDISAASDRKLMLLRSALVTGVMRRCRAMRGSVLSTHACVIGAPRT